MACLVKELITLLVGLFRPKVSRHAEAQSHAAELLQKACDKRNQVEGILGDPDAYLSLKVLEAFVACAVDADTATKVRGVSRHLKSEALKLRSYGGRLLELRKTHNAIFMERMKDKYKALFASVEGHALDDQQIECVVREDDNILVVAGAGSGKTTTIVGKVKYLLETRKCQPHDLLVLSFTNASASEMRERLQRETGHDIDVMTFHKLGLSVIADVEEKKPSITSLEAGDLVRSALHEMLRYHSYLRAFVNYFTSHLREYKSRFDFKSEEEFLEETKDGLRTLNGESVKSHEEVEIANFLYLNGINYKYEQSYEVETATIEYSQYKPDFYLPNYGIYIEHFGVDRNGNVPAFFTGRKGMTAKQVYQEGMEWKRKTHRANGTILVETFSYEKAEGSLLTNLGSKLEKLGVTFSPLEPNSVITTLREKAADDMNGLVELLVTFLNLIKGNNLTPQELRQRSATIFKGPGLFRANAFLSIFEPLYDYYEKTLKDRGEIDFNDMINKATNYVIEGHYTKNYKHIIIDEYQDISRSRYGLVKALRDGSQAKVFCVGDDWQSIYRFAGSDISFFLNFEEYWGSTERCLIETTYRFGQSVIDLSSSFILRNPAQIQKRLRCPKASTQQAYDFITSSNERFVPADVKQKLNTLPHGSKVLLLGRYTRDIYGFVAQDFKQKGRGSTYSYSPRSDLHIDFLTVHRSKGLQADYVFIINNKKGRLGFPSNIQDDSILGLVLERQEKYPYAEERRLFYVALTRAKQFVWICTAKDNSSVFVTELQGEARRIFAGDSKICPECGAKLRYIRGGRGPFWGCSQYPRCSYTRNKRSQRGMG